MRNGIHLSSILFLSLLAACLGGPDAFAMKWKDLRQSSNLEDQRFVYPATGTIEELERAIANFDSSSRAILSLASDLSGASPSGCSIPPALQPDFDQLGQIIDSVAMQDAREKLARLLANARASGDLSRENLAKIDVCADSFDDLLKSAKALEASATFWSSNNSLIKRLLLSVQDASRAYENRARRLPAEERRGHAEALAMLAKAVKENDAAIDRLNSRIADNVVRVEAVRAHLLKVRERADCGISFL